MTGCTFAGYMSDVADTCTNGTYMFPIDNPEDYKDGEYTGSDPESNDAGQMEQSLGCGNASSEGGSQGSEAASESAGASQGSSEQASSSSKQEWGCDAVINFDGSQGECHEGGSDLTTWGEKSACDGVCAEFQQQVYCCVSKGSECSVEYWEDCPLTSMYPQSGQVDCNSECLYN